MTVTPVQDTWTADAARAPLPPHESGRHITDAAMLAAILAASHDALICHSSDGAITLWNPGAERLFGYSRSEAVGRDISLIVPAGHEYAITAQVLSREMVCVTRNRHLVDVLLTQSPLMDAGGMVTGAVIVGKDLSPLKQAERGIEQRVAERTAALAAANRELDTFAYSVSHDLRAPLRAIQGYAAMLRQQCGDALGADAVKSLQGIARYVAQMNTLIEGLLAISRLHHTSPRRTRVSMNALVAECVATLGAADRARVVEWRIAPLPDCAADPTLLRQVWMNLLSNAFKFTAKRTAACIEISSASSPEGTVYQVRDNGAGFDMRYAGKLFGVFQRLHDAAEFAGHGIGLATSSKIVSLHGGRLWADAVPDQGATFSFTLGTESA